MKSILFLGLALLLASCSPMMLHYKHSCISESVPDGVYVLHDYGYYYWGYSIELSVKGELGIARITDARSSFATVDTLRYRQSGFTACVDEFAGQYLRFIRTESAWILNLENPVSGSHFYGVYDFTSYK